MKKFLKTILKCLSYFIIWALLVGIPIPDSLSPALWRFFAELLPLILLIIISLVYMKFVDKEFYDLKLKAKEVINYFKGIILGMIWIISAIGISMITKSITISGKNSINISIWGISLLLNTLMQELLIRGYLYQMLRKKYNVIIAFVFTTCLFTLLHGGAFEAGLFAVINVISMSLFMTLLLEYYNSLIIPILVHFIWNFVGGLIFDVVSLASDYPHILNTISSENLLLSGGTFKIEGSIIVSILNIAFVTIYAILLYKKRKQNVINS